MNSSIRVSTLRRSLPIALALGALAVVSARAHAADFDEITISSSAVKTVGYETATHAPIEEASVTARVAFDPVTLTTNSGVALLKDSMLKAAHEVCDAADPLTPDDGSCVQTAIKSARPQLEAAIARARSSVNG